MKLLFWFPFQWTIEDYESRSFLWFSSFLSPIYIDWYYCWRFFYLWYRYLVAWSRRDGGKVAWERYIGACLVGCPLANWTGPATTRRFVWAYSRTSESAAADACSAMRRSVWAYTATRISGIGDSMTSSSAWTCTGIGIANSSWTGEYCSRLSSCSESSLRHAYFGVS